MKQLLYHTPHINENEVREERLGSAWLRVAKWDLGLGGLALRGRVLDPSPASGRA